MGFSLLQNYFIKRTVFVVLMRRSGTRCLISINLAEVKKYLHGANSMPFVVDDILVYFDECKIKVYFGCLSGASGENSDNSIYSPS